MSQQCKCPNKNRKYLLLFFTVLFGVLLGAHFLGTPEDTWLCNTGTGMWVKHGNPAAPMPEGPCP